MLLKIIISTMIWCFIMLLPFIYKPTNETPKHFRIFCWYEFIVLIVGTIILFNLK